MAIVKPFKGLRTPNQAFCEELACLPYDVMNSEEAAQMAAGKPKSLLHVTRAEIDCPVERIYIPRLYIIKVSKTLTSSRKKDGSYRTKPPNSIFTPKRWTGEHNTGLLDVPLVKTT